MKVKESEVKSFKDNELEAAMQYVGFPVVEQPVFLQNGQTVPGKKAIVRADTGRILSVVSNSYAVFRNSDVLAAPINAIMGGGFKVHRASLREGGAQTIVELIGQEKYQLTDHENETYVKRLIVTNSYDQSSSVTVKFGSFRLICTNGAGVWAESVYFKYIHKGRNIQFGDINGKVHNALSQYSRQWDSYTSALKLLGSVQLNEALLKTVETKLALSDRSSKNVNERLQSNIQTGESRATLLAVYNAYTEELRDREHRHQTVSVENMNQSSDLLGKLVEVAHMAAA